MSSIKCPRCNLPNWVEAPACKRCGAELAPGGSPYQRVPNYVQPAAAFAEASHDADSRIDPNLGRPSQLKTGLALASMILGIVAIPTSILLFGLVLAPIGLVLGIVALVKVSKKPSVYGGSGFAVAGIATSAVAMIFFLPFVAAIAIPNLLAAKRAADEGSAISSLRTVSAAEAIYMATVGNGSCGDLSSLAKAGLIKPDLAAGIKNDFQFEVVVSGPKRNICEIFATPTAKVGRGRSFMVSDDGVIRAADKKGQKASRSDPAISN